MATKKAKSAPATAKRAVAVLPKGFTRIESGMIPFWSPGDSERNHPNTLEGKLLEFRTIPARKKGEEDQLAFVMHNEADDAKYTVTRSHTIKDLFGNKLVKAGTRVFLQYLGRVAVKGRKQGMKDIACGFKNGK